MTRTRKLAWMASLLSAAAMATPAAAQGVPDMVGTWRGTSRAAIVGATPYRPHQGEGAQFTGQPLEFTYRIDRQEGNRFLGQVSAGPRRETLLGAISGDGRTGVMQDDDGQSTFTLRAPDAMDICHAHNAANNRAVTCFTLTRTR